MTDSERERERERESEREKKTARERERETETESESERRERERDDNDSAKHKVAPVSPLGVVVAHHVFRVLCWPKFGAFLGTFLPTALAAPTTGGAIAAVPETRWVLDLALPLRGGHCSLGAVPDLQRLPLASSRLCGDC